MIDYTKLAWVLKRKIFNFSKNICKGLKRPEEKLICYLLYGIAESGSCHLSKIGRALKEKITLKKTIDRLSVGLRDFKKEDAQKLQDNYNESIRKNVDDRTVYVIDFDALLYYEYFLKARELFIIRAKKNRDVRYNGETINMMKLAGKYKGKYSINFKDKKGKNVYCKGKNVYCKIAVIPLSLPKYPQIPLHLVVVYGFGKEPMLLLTNLESEDKRLANTITKVYLMRWRIEEYFRFKKQQYELEDFRVRSLNAIRVLHRVVTLLAGLIGVLSDQRDESLFVLELIQMSRRIYTPKKEKWKRKFFHYAVGDAFFILLRRCSVGISAFLTQPQPNPQISFLPAA